MMEPLQAVPSAGYCQDCSELIATMLKGGGLFRPAASTNWTKEPWSLWPTTQDCKLCKMTSTSSYGQVRGWTSFLADEHAPGMTRVTPIIGIQSSQRAIAGFQVVSGYGCNFTFSIWSENGEVWVPEDSGFEPDSRNGPGRRSLPISTRPPPDTNYGEKDFDLIRSWFATCHDHHEGCRVTTAELISEDYEAILPTRLIDIDRIAEGVVTLVDTTGTRGSFCALSYCWGSSKQKRTTKTTLSEHQNGIDINELPQVFKDAIRITHEIGLRYLWVDSLCIIQDDEEDWSTEANRMSEVYQNADLVIAAAGAYDPTEGCFLKRKTSAFPPLLISTIPTTEDFEESKSIWVQEYVPGRGPSRGPLQTRGWTLQETILARRSIHFMPSGMYWRCQELKADERIGEPVIHINDWLSFLTDFSSKKEHRLLAKHTDDWLSLLTNFSKRQLSKKEDRLIAIQGLVNVISNMTKLHCGYHKGIFIDRIPEQILWTLRRLYVDEKMDKGETWDGAPTWSWAHIGGSKTFWFERDWLKYTLQADKSQAQVILSDEDVLQFSGYSSDCQVLQRLPQNAVRSDKYEAAVLWMVDWWAKEVHTMICSDKYGKEVVGYAAPDAEDLNKVTALFIAERTWESIQMHRQQG
ncbi:heterokaryon incompatibility protein-domain-containing protein [Fusarium oxysporum f. sp. albedinis]|nr:heterokaryon incompatibility protein-domain-containing protein [Fusarium oxysporum f. sp. albedinis]